MREIVSSSECGNKKAKTHIGDEVSSEDHQTTLLFDRLDGCVPGEAARRKIRFCAPDLAQEVVALFIIYWCCRFQTARYARFNDMKEGEIRIRIAKAGSQRTERRDRVWHAHL